jgi:electron transport complex protein RnfB
MAPTAAQIDALLPQTQCTRCGYGGCRPYAEAMARGEVLHNRCPPGGTEVVAALARLLGRAPLPLDPACGSEAIDRVAWVDPEACIGCARCLPACPVDAIVGAQRHLHTVLQAACNGCELCLPACPVDCIHLRPRADGIAVPTAAANRTRFERQGARLQRESDARATALTQAKRAALPAP